jgi:threonine synthase
LLEPSSAASFAAYKKMTDRNKLAGEKSLLLFTGNGLKDSSALAGWNENLSPMTGQELKNYFR